MLLYLPCTMQGITIWVSKPKTEPIVAPKDPLFDFSECSEQISQDMQTDDKEETVTTSIERSVINRWLTDKRRLRSGRFSKEFTQLILWLIEDHNKRVNQSKKRVCVSMCGPRAVAVSAQRCINAAAKQAGVKIDVELRSETQ
jgi:hypothetical protein